MGAKLSLRERGSGVLSLPSPHLGSRVALLPRRARLQPLAWPWKPLAWPWKPLARRWKPSAGSSALSAAQDGTSIGPLPPCCSLSSALLQRPAQRGMHRARSARDRQLPGDPQVSFPERGAQAEPAPVSGRQDPERDTVGLGSAGSEGRFVPQQGSALSFYQPGGSCKNSS